MDGLNFPPITGQHFGWAVIDEVVSRPPGHEACRVSVEPGLAPEHKRDLEPAIYPHAGGSIPLWTAAGPANIPLQVSAGLTVAAAQV